MRLLMFAWSLLIVEPIYLLQEYIQWAWDRSDA